MIDARFIYVTCEDRKQAMRIGETLVSERLAACVNVIDGMTAIFSWKGSVETGGETILVAKTIDDRVPALTDRVRELHSYECPCVVALPIVGGNSLFLEWIASETRGAE